MLYSRPWSKFANNRTFSTSKHLYIKKLPNLTELDFGNEDLVLDCTYYV